MYTVALNFEDGVTRFVGCRPGETVADASYRIGINIPLDCRDGACGTCRVHCESGRFDPGSYIEDALSDEEAAQGYGLACQMRPRTDLVLAVAASSHLCKTGGAAHKGTIGAVRRLSDTTFGLTVETPEPIGFLPGQYVNIALPGSGQQRSYSFSSAPGGTRAEFLIRNIPGGLMSTYLAEAAKPGASLDLTGPAGSFYLREIRRPVLMLAGGTGLAPFLSMLGRIAEGGSPHPVHLVYGVTHDADLVEVEALEKAAAAIPGFSFATCVASPDSAHPRKGYVTEHLAPEHLNGGDVDTYLCGPPAMVDAVRRSLSERGVTPASFHYEKFAASGAGGAA
ncbi:oxidoreductase FAD/NAD(P)-binding domain protein [Methylobacterium sp. 4-46]|uniref:benzoate 1,2-dioxygenase electron transfer component BenC n=1 Tax=unclassified Methylobacterium TaxID=2615210 RepID=UPI000152CDEE|nr:MULTISPECIES: benzoate 1,2-dioxygenase electron transfer component BenC [Methylobacterium]ACA15842.1 oxidoreductase FAD/NAD(P)-binding domain protein [Methylobacterium sp. 4-46]WFT81570.1 benzoate 1,2-dioxygenase electron transfer component BenC [Methylobacterium nodulans]